MRIAPRLRGALVEPSSVRSAAHMEKVLKDSSKVIVEQGNGQGVVPYLPLPALQAKPPAPVAPAANTGGTQ